MKRTLIALAGLLTFFLFAASADAQKKTMTWTTASDKAKTLCGEGVNKFFNIEFAQAYEKMKAAIELDPEFTVALVFMTNLTQGDLRKKYTQRVKNSLKGKTDAEKMFASTVYEDATPEKNRDTYKKLFSMFPDGSMLGGWTIFTATSPDEQFKACEAYLKKFPDQAWVYNLMGYYYMQQKKDMAKAKDYFEKYVAAYPEGYNPYDSMGEYYFNNGDMENSTKYYRMSLDRYPFNNSSINKLADMRSIPKKMHGFKPAYSANFIMDRGTNAETVLALWKDWQDGDLSKCRDHFADSVSMFMPDGTQIIGRTEDILKGMQEYRSSFTGMEVTVDAVFPVRSMDKNESWVAIWGTEKQTKNGKTESVSLQETWRFNSAGKIDMMFQAARKGILPPPPGN